jgi:hypothetical protein
MTLTHSYRKVPYDIRPAKQAERRMLVDAFQLLTEAGFMTRDFQYTGMGSVHYVDFILFHRLLGITRLLSVEKSEEIRRRVQFNRPFEMIDVKIGGIGDEIENLSADLKHIVWFDYDDVLTREQLQDIAYACTKLPPQSILLVTVDAEPPGPSGSGASDWMEHFVAEAEDYLDRPIVPTQFGRDLIAHQCVKCVTRAMEKAIVERQEVEIIPMFNFEYSDGNRMITVGGMIGTETDKRNVERSRLAKAPYYRSSFESKPFVIRVPRLTRKERVLLDSRMPTAPGWHPEEFEITPEDVEAYKQIYRFLPAYGELLW